MKSNTKEVLYLVFLLMILMNLVMRIKQIEKKQLEINSEISQLWLNI